MKMSVSESGSVTSLWDHFTSTCDWFISHSLSLSHTLSLSLFSLLSLSYIPLPISLSFYFSYTLSLFLYSLLDNHSSFPFRLQFSLELLIFVLLVLVFANV